MNQAEQVADKGIKREESETAIVELVEKNEELFSDWIG